MAALKNTDISKRVIITDDGVVRYFWNAWVWALLGITMGLFFTGIGISNMLDDGGLPLCFALPELWLPGLALLYYGIGKAINYTEFRMMDNNLIVQHKPLPWRGNLSIPLSKIESVDIGLHIEDITNKWESRRAATGYLIFANRPGAKKRGKELCKGLSLESADALTWELENMLGKPHYPDREERTTRLRKQLTQYNSKAKR